MNRSSKQSGADGQLPQNAELLPLLYRVEEKLGWSIGMRSITHTLLQRRGMPEGLVLELGCGGGQMLAELGRLWPERPMYGIELNAYALAIARGRRTSALLAQADLGQTPYRSSAFGLCLALDVFDQRDVAIDVALRESWRVLQPDGLLLVRVSAHSWLQGPHDAAFNTGKRYSKVELMAALEQAGYAVERVTYANLLLLAPVAVVRLLQRWRVLPFLPSLYVQQVVNELLMRALTLESQWVRTRPLPTGMSLFALARKIRVE